LLDLLCAEAQGDAEPKLSYAAYMAAFERDDDRFYPSDARVSDPGPMQSSTEYRAAVEQLDPRVSPSVKIEGASGAEGIIRSLYRRLRK